MRIAVLGAGQVGATTAMRVVERDLGEVVLIDIVPGLAQGKALDLMDAAALVGQRSRVTGTTELSAMRDAAVVIVTAGLARKPGMSRDDLLRSNAEIVQRVGEGIREHAPAAVVLVVTNPLDVMAYLTWKTTGFPPPRVLGMAGVLDAARLRGLLAEAVGVRPADVEALVLGTHGDTMVPLTRLATAGGVPIGELLDAPRLRAVEQRTRDRGAEVVSLLGSGSAFSAPAAAVCRMVEAIVRDERCILPASAYLTGQYGQRDVYLGVPVRLGGGGVAEILEVALTPEERAALGRSAEQVREGIARLSEVVAAPSPPRPARG